MASQERFRFQTVSSADDFSEQRLHDLLSDGKIADFFEGCEHSRNEMAENKIIEFSRLHNICAVRVKKVDVDVKQMLTSTFTQENGWASHYDPDLFRRPSWSSG